MKTKFYAIFMMMTAMAMMSSCVPMDDDMVEARVLDGQWNGDFGMYYTYAYTDRYGRVHETTYDCYDTDIEFIRGNNAYSGYGYQVDHYEYGPYSTLYYKFYWEVRNGRIYIEYPSDPDWNTVIYDYRLSNRYFSGYFANSDSRFRMEKIYGYYDWSPYCGVDYGYICYDDYGYYYAREDKFSGAETDSVATATADTTPTIRRGNRYLDAGK